MTLSRRQASWPRSGSPTPVSSGRVEMRLQDYRDVDDGPYDAMSSIGMFEHVGAAALGEYFAGSIGLLRPAGRLLNHGIVGRRPACRGRDRRGSSTATCSPTVSCSRSAGHRRPCRAGFEVRHARPARALRLTLRHWVANLEAMGRRGRRVGEPGPVGAHMAVGRRGRRHRCCVGVKLPLTPLDFLARARRLFPQQLAVVQGDDVAVVVRRARRPLRRAGPPAPRRRRRAARRPGRLPRRQHPPAPRGLLRGAARRCRPRAPQHPELGRRTGHLPRRLPGDRLRPRPVAPRPGVRRRHLRPRRLGPRRPIRSSRRRSTRTTPRRSSTRPARPGPPRARSCPTGRSTSTPCTTRSPTPSPATTCCCTRSRSSTSTGGARRTSSPGSGAPT